MPTTQDHDGARYPASTRAYRAIGILSPGIWKIPHLNALLPEAGRIARLYPGAGLRMPRDVEAIAGWGMKPTAARARRLAARHGLPYLALEEGFVRSLGSAALGYSTLSLVLDESGIYYDATRPSALEMLLQEADLGALLEEAHDAIARIRATRLSKLNTALDLAPDELDAALTNSARQAVGKPLVLVIDQSFGDMSVELGLAGPRQFEDMLLAALDENPEALVVVKLHPEVVAGRQRGYLVERAAALGVPVIESDLNPISLLERATRVYVVSSQFGMEALLCDVPVSCFGMPYYAGWGATDDRYTCARRTRRRTTLEIFAAAYLAYGRYIDPITSAPCRLGRLLDRLTVMKRVNQRNEGVTIALGFSSMKRPHVAPFLATTSGHTRFVDDPDRARERALAAGGRICCWASREPEGLAEAAAKAKVPLVRVEDGFLRSVGLGSDLVPAASLVFDRRGIYYDPRRPSDLEDILAQTAFDEATLAAARRLRSQLIATGISKYNTGGVTLGALPTDGRLRILVPGQVEDDASVRVGGGAIKTNLELLRAVRSERPDALIIFKPHPDVESGYRVGAVPDAQALAYCDLILRGVNPIAALDAIDEVHTLTSLLGFEALLRGVAVTTYGAPFYAGWGLTYDRLHFPRRHRGLELDELVAGALILYPSYVDPVTGLPCDAETVARRLAETRQSGRSWRSARPRWLRQLLRGLRAVRLVVSVT